jgi:hypothetical protein
MSSTAKLLLRTAVNTGVSRLAFIFKPVQVMDEAIYRAKPSSEKRHLPSPRSGILKDIPALGFCNVHSNSMCQTLVGIWREFSQLSDNCQIVNTPGILEVVA